MSMSSGGPIEATILGKILEWAWLGIAALVGVVWRKHAEETHDMKTNINKMDGDMNAHAKYLSSRIDGLERATVPRTEYEQNRREVREVQVETFKRLDLIGQSLARIEGKLDR